MAGIGLDWLADVCKRGKILWLSPDEMAALAARGLGIALVPEQGSHQPRSPFVGPIPSMPAGAYVTQVGLVEKGGVTMFGVKIAHPDWPAVAEGACYPSLNEEVI